MALPRPRLPRAATPRFVTGTVLLALAAGLAACDNALCVFGPSGCFGPGSGGAGSLGTTAVLPNQDQHIATGPPQIVAVYPGANGPFLHSKTALAVVFSESMNPATLQGAFEVSFLDLGGFPAPPLPALSTLVGNGRVLILLPAAPLTAGDYQLALSPNQDARDLTGQLLDATGTSTPLSTFSINLTDPTVPLLLGTYPAAGGTLASATGEFVMLFDRPLDNSSVTPASFSVTVDGNLALSSQPALPLTINTGLIPILDTRIYTWNYLDGALETIPMGAGASVSVSISPASNPILDADGGTVVPGTVGFTTLSFSKPNDVVLLSMPANALGIANLTKGDAQEVSLGVGLDDAAVGDRIYAWFFGPDVGGAQPPGLVAVERQISLSGPDFSSGTFDFDALALTLSQAPLMPVFGDGDIAVAVSLNRGTSFSPIRVLDADTLEAGLQDLIQDTVRPSLLSIVGAAQGSNDYLSPYRTVSVTGIASEEIAFAEVSVPSLSLNNGAGVVVGSDQTGIFLAPPVDPGALPVGGKTLAYELLIYDRARNVADALTSGTYTQVGSVNPDPVVPGGTIAVRVIDTQTLLPVAGALVLSNADDGGAYPALGQATTDANGDASVPAHGAGQLGTIITVSHASYDLWTFQRVTSRQFDIPLTPAVSLPAVPVISGGAVVATTLSVGPTLQGLDRRVSESRQPTSLAVVGTGVGAGTGFPFPTVQTAPCSGFPLSAVCAWGPLQVLPELVGAASVVAGNTLLLESQFGAGSLIKAFRLTLPTAPASSASPGVVNLPIDSFLDDAGTPADELPLEQLTARLLTVAATGIDTANLVDDPAYTGAPSVTVEARVPGLGGTVAVGLGLAYKLAADDWRVRSAIPGAASPTGDLVTSGAIDPELLLHAEIRDAGGNVAGTRASFVDLQTAGPPFVVFPGSVPQFLFPVQGGATGGQAFTIMHTDALIDALGLLNYEGIFRVTLVHETSLRRWVLWRPNSPDAAFPIDVRCVDVGAAGGVPLQDGNLQGTLSAFAWKNFDDGDFLWSDVRRQYDLYGHSAPIQFSKP